MQRSRRDFLKLAGVSALGLSAGTLGFLGEGAQAADALPSAADFAKPAKAKQWGMVIDTAKFDDALFKKCIDACHDNHNVPKIEGKQEIKWIWTEDFEGSFPTERPAFLAEAQEHRKYLLLCNHCANPACTRVCPTKATFKNDEGLVIMDYHRCIGCRYCMAGCPYGARSFNFRDPGEFIAKDKLNLQYPHRTRGVVEKCTFCVEKLAQGKLPLCVEASGGAMVFGDLEDPKSEVRKVLKEKYAIRRKPDAGTDPSVFYIL
ncbi:sulfate reduction electron transfer complex DsrMKJOP subunit DsrO [Fundidesulfovibrio agrisoli]|uniref:sulfate reduction electron transfer complex DsrMKJOP subunit DsrO n=1 Tax=Fundidesulfovibrio agrisoli TaxID=2922717 RepID=UPI001FADCD67|nr:4Fe-4S dicluster domain-containing protein [Fundidesulfovibrio agrisoli]